MAIHQLIISVLARARGDHAVEVAARYAGEVLRDRRTSILYDGSTEADVVYREIMGPVSGTESAWWRDRETLWNIAEQHELRSNSRVARDWLVGLPHELTAAATIKLARAWGDFIATRYGVAVDLSVHRPPAGGDPRNHYARLLSTTRRDQSRAYRRACGRHWAARRLTVLCGLVTPVHHALRRGVASRSIASSAFSRSSPSGICLASAI